MEKGIAFFDFDGTITKKDTLLEFIKFSKGTASFYAGFLLYSPFLVAYKLKIITNQKAKEKVLKHFFGGMPVPEFNQYCQKFSDTILSNLVRPGAIEEIKKLQSQGIKIVIVSASPENWIRQWADKCNAELIATELEIQDNKLTGNIKGINCHGDEKVCRIKNDFDLSGYSTIYAYGDSSGDKPMLSLAQHAFMKPFRQ